MTAAQHEALYRAIGKLLFDAELVEADNAVGTYPPEWLMTLRLAWIAAGRAATQAHEPSPAEMS